MPVSLPGIFMKVVNQRDNKAGYLCRFDLLAHCVPTAARASELVYSLVMNYFGIETFFEYSFQCLYDNALRLYKESSRNRNQNIAISSKSLAILKASVEIFTIVL